MRPVRLITLAGDPQREPEVAAAISRNPSLDLVLRCVDRVEALAAIRGGSIDLALAVGRVSWFDFQCLQEARAKGVRIIGVAADPVEVETLEVAGIEVLPADRSVADLPDIVSFSDQMLVDDLKPSREGRIVAVWGPKGAPGRSSLALEVAVALAETEPAILLLDVDLYGGDIGQLAGLTDELPGLVPLTRRAAKGELAAGAWPDDLLRIPPRGPLFVPGLLRAELWEEVSIFGWDALMEAARERFRFTLVDVGFCLEPDAGGLGAPRGRNQVARSTVAAADHVVAVVRADPVGMKTFLWALNDARDLDLKEKLLIVLNRVRPGEARDLRGVLSRRLARSPIAEIPERPDLFTRALWKGRAVSNLDPASDVAAEIRNVAASLGGVVAPRGFLTRLAGRSRV